MKTFISIILIIISFTLQGQSLIGAWESTTTSKSGLQFKSVVIFTENYQVLTTYDLNTGKFKNTNGGSWSLDGDILTEKVEFNASNPELLGTEKRYKIIFKNETFYIEGSNQKFTRIDDGTPGDLSGAWLMSGRKRDGVLQSRDTQQARKTMKILSGTRFQWIAYNTNTKEFRGTGGGTYTTKEGVYTENIEFFSKDIARVGAKLKFSYEIIDDDWHHSGLSSKGKPIYEIWTKRD